MARQSASTVRLRGNAAEGYTYDISTAVHGAQVESALLASPGSAGGVELEFGADGGSRRLELRLAGLPGADVELAGAALRIVPLAHELPRALPAADTSALDVHFPADVTITSLRLVGLTLPGQGGTFHRFSRGGVTVRTPPPEDDDAPEPTYTSVRAVLAAGPAGGPLGPPAVGFNGFGPPGPLYGDQLPSGTVSGSASSMLLRPPRPLRAGRLRLTFCTDDGDPTTLAPVPFSVAAAEIARAAQPSGVTIDVDGVRAFEHGPELGTSAHAELDPILSAVLRTALEDAEDADGSVTVPIVVGCAGPARLRIEAVGATVTLVRRAFDRSPAAIALTGGSAAITVPPPLGPAPAAARSRLTGAFGAVRRTAASPAGFAPPSVSGHVATDMVHMARLILPAALEGRPLARLGLLGASTEGELVVEVRADAAGPGAPLLPPGIVALATTGRARWIGVVIEALTPDRIPPGGLWLVVRTNRGRFLWADEAGPGPPGTAAQAGDARRSEDAGATWRRIEAAPALQLFVEDPGGGAALVAAVGAQQALLLASAGEETFDVVATWPPALRAALGGEQPVRLELDCARDVRLEIADLQLRHTRTLTLQQAPA